MVIDNMRKYIDVHFLFPYTKDKEIEYCGSREGDKNVKRNKNGKSKGFATDR